jgi:microtubule-associated protein-like 6
MPTGFQPAANAAKAPNGNLRLKYAHGFRCRGVQGNLKVAKDGRIVYSTAALGVVLDPSSGT